MEAINFVKVMRKALLSLTKGLESSSYSIKVFELCRINAEPKQIKYFCVSNSKFL